MSATDLAVVIGWLVSSWAIGFTGGYTLTLFKRATETL